MRRRIHDGAYRIAYILRTGRSGRRPVRLVARMRMGLHSGAGWVDEQPIPVTNHTAPLFAAAIACSANATGSVEAARSR